MMGKTDRIHVATIDDRLLQKHTIAARQAPCKTLWKCTWNWIYWGGARRGNQYIYIYIAWCSWNVCTRTLRRETRGTWCPPCVNDVLGMCEEQRAISVPIRGAPQNVIRSRSFVSIAPSSDGSANIETRYIFFFFCFGKHIWFISRTTAGLKYVYIQDMLSYWQLNINQPHSKTNRSRNGYHNID